MLHDFQKYQTIPIVELLDVYGYFANSILIILQMNSIETETAQAEGSKPEKRVTQPQNPRKAATKLKEVNNNLQTMKRRFKVLQVQDEYNRYRTVDQEKRINQHMEIHSRLLKDRELLKKSLEKVKDTSEVKEQAEQIREEIKEKIKEARKNLMEQRTERVNQISEQFMEHTQLIREHRDKDFEENKERSMTVKFMEEKKRQSVSRHMEEKARSIRLNKSIDSSSMSKKAERGEEELSRMMMYQQELLKKSSESLQASQVMKHKFNQVFATISTISGNSSRFLPEIRIKTNNGKYTGDTNSTEM